MEDLSGNKKEVSYAISNIDKEPPQIIGIENGVTYYSAKSVQYVDNVGIKDIEINKYHNNLIIKCEEDFYDSDYYKGLDVLGNKIYVDVLQHPKGTEKYRFYLNGQLKATTEISEYTFKGLSNATTYTIKVEAINSQNQVIQSASKTVKTKCFTGITATKTGDTFNVKITGIDSRVNVGYCTLWNQDSSIQKTIYPGMNSDRSINLSFNAYDVDGKKCKGYYYFHLQLFSTSDPSLNEIVCMNVIFDTIFTKKEEDNTVNPNNLNKSGNYEIIVTDLAGNKTVRNCKISI